MEINFGKHCITKAECRGYKEAWNADIEGYKLTEYPLHFMQSEHSGRFNLSFIRRSRSLSSEDFIDARQTDIQILTVTSVVVRMA
jgi:hypothetical protein